MVRPVFIDRFEAVEVFFEVVLVVDDEFTARVVDFTLRRGRRHGGLEVFFAVLAPPGVAHLEHGIFLQLRLDAFLQRHDGKLQNLHRLNHPRSQNHLLVHPLRHTGV